MTGDKKRIFFTDREGKEIDGREVSEEGTNIHEILAEYILSQDEQLTKKFQQSKIELKTIFLIIEGYLYGTELEGGRKDIICFPRNLSSRVKEMIFEYYRLEGFKIHDIEKEMGEFFKEILGEKEEER